MAHGELEVSAVRDDVVLGAGVKRADGNHAGVSRRQAAAHHGLQGQHNLRSQDNGIDTAVRAGPVSADAVDDNVHRIRARILRAERRGQLAGRNHRRHMQRHRPVRFAETLPEPVLHHVARAGDALLGGLTDQHQRARPLAAPRLHLPGGTHQAGNVHVVTAGVHHVDFLTARAGLARCRGVGQTAFFLNRKSVHIRAHHDQGPGTVFQHGDKPGAAHVFRHRKTGLAQLRGQTRGGLMLHKRELGMAMEVNKEIAEVRIVVAGDGLAQGVLGAVDIVGALDIANILSPGDAGDQAV